MDNDFQKRLLATFRVETREHLTALSSGLIKLEKSVPEVQRQEILEAVFREAHSLKGAARAVNVSGIESLCHAMESVFASLRREKSLPSAAVFDLLHRAIDTIEKELPSIEGGEDASAKSRVRELVRGLEKAMKGTSSSPPPPKPLASHDSPPLEKPAVADTVRISALKLDSLFQQTEEMLSAKLAALQRAEELGEIRASLTLWEKEWKKARPAMRSLGKSHKSTTGQLLTDVDSGQMTKLLAFLEWNQTAIKSLETSVDKLTNASALDRHFLNGMADNLLEDVKEMLMFPCATVLEGLPKIVRELSRDRGKEAELLIVGETVEIDKRVLEELKDPLIHLLRNCIDHGIEKPEERQRRNKPMRGVISVTVSHIGSSRIEIVVADDGAGIDTARLAAAAARQCVAPAAEANMGRREELLELAFTSGVSTTPLITDISGRGLGLAIVREKVEKLGGTITVVSEPLRGTSFRMVLPLTLSTYRGVLVRVGEQKFIVPAAGVDRVTRVDKASLRTVENRETVELGGEAVSLVRLSDILQLPSEERGGADSGLIPLFLIGSGAHRIAFAVDGILAEQEVLVKSLGPQLSRVRNIAGATVLGTGRVVTILHPGDLVKSAVTGSARMAGGLSPAENAETARKSVLIVEDSITARAVLKNILETAGYRTITAVDGIDALTRLKTEEIDFVLSDVDMPRLNGFDLTARIRATKEFADLPVALVTSLDSREDRERGIEAGANAYIVKSSFDQSNLLEVIKRLI